MPPRARGAQPWDLVGELRLFIVRGADHETDVGWEIRRFGALAVERSPCGYGSAAAARQAGEVALRGAKQR